MSWKPLSGGRKHNRLPFFIRGGKLYDQRFGGTHEALQAKDLLDPDIVTIDDLPLIRDLRDQLQQAIEDGDNALADLINDFIDVFSEQMQDLLSQVALSVNRMVAPGMTIFHDNRSGGLSVTQMRQRGWAVEDGTTYEAQLVDTGFYSVDDLAFTGLTENLIDPVAGRGGLFVRAAAMAGAVQDHALFRHAHKLFASGVYTYNASPGSRIYDNAATGTMYARAEYWGNNTYDTTLRAGGIANGLPTRALSSYPVADPNQNPDSFDTDENRPVNIGRIPMIFALKQI